MHRHRHAPSPSPFLRESQQLNPSRRECRRTEEQKTSHLLDLGNQECRERSQQAINQVQKSLTHLIYIFVPFVA